MPASVERTRACVRARARVQVHVCCIGAWRAEVAEAARAPQDGPGGGAGHEGVVAVPVLAEDDVGVRLAHDLQDFGRVRVPCGDSVRLELRPLRLGHRAREARVVVDGHRGLLVSEDHDTCGGNDACDSLGTLGWRLEAEDPTNSLTSHTVNMAAVPPASSDACLITSHSSMVSCCVRSMLVTSTPRWADVALTSRPVSWSMVPAGR